ncbi:MAG: hypothetical protein K6U14_00270 [Firmicutes bacterium]|nr:hypothetical protein [Alicyclobacillaceae bacterium]MCL6496055.1 hypothetical protein [Bacillota bacterium]
MRLRPYRISLPPRSRRPAEAKRSRGPEPQWHWSPALHVGWSHSDLDPANWVAEIAWADNAGHTGWFAAHGDTPEAACEALEQCRASLGAEWVPTGPRVLWLDDPAPDLEALAAWARRHAFHLATTPPPPDPSKP